MPIQWLLAVMLAVATTPAMARDAAQDEREILSVEKALCHAFETGDADYLRRSLDEHFILTSSNGVVTDRAQNIAEVEKRDPSYEVFRNHDQKLRLYGDAAIVTGITTVKGQSGGEAFEADFQFTDTWVYRDGQWKLAASHASRLAKK
ncbi:nuclear transport factor 2 family protein [Lysobacter sp. CFH 32150]|uniref:nuclear transport factor 2 family protein n=1 Tax=Lysobacter sp. CFH 32150 TaxID=2927128 RepID=UPI001FA6ED38|nr:nuclear transport factor 2 family protein [Lysobacter sp. CFH 32150]MCI4569326.1 nuclear transport factor 2 family protein [Lysobacter sp. CFH 32150]